MYTEKEENFEEKLECQQQCCSQDQAIRDQDQDHTPQDQDQKSETKTSNLQDQDQDQRLLNCDPASQNHQKVARHGFLVKARF